MDNRKHMRTEKKTAVKSSEKFYDLGSCLTVYYPVLQDQNIVGIIRVIYPETNVTTEIMQELVHIIQNVFVFLLVMIGFLAIVCFLLLRSLNKIKHALSDFSVGIDLDEPPKEGNGTEMREITNLFYHMTINIREHLQHIDQLERAYEPYIPQSLISLFEKKDICEISPAESSFTSSHHSRKSIADHFSYDDRRKHFIWHRYRLRRSSYRHHR